MTKKRKKGPKQVTLHGVTYHRSSGVDTAMIQRYKEKIEKEVRQSRSPKKKSGEGTIHVRSHTRRGTKGVRAHTRRKKR